MRVLATLLLTLAVGCHTTPDSDPPASPTTSRARVPRNESSAPNTFGGVEEMVVAGSTVAFDTSNVASYAPNLEIAEPEAVGPPGQGADVARREVIYTADLEVIVVSADQASRTVRSMAESAGGHLQESDSQSITIRVPASKFDYAIEQITSLGEVVERSITASDVGEEMLDLGIRLENARKTRDRLLEHLARSQKVTDTLKIEAELSRVSETIEEIEGKIRFMRSQIDMSTISVAWIGEKAVGTSPSLGVPFRWIDGLGDGLVAGLVEPMTRRPHLLDFAPKFEPPPDFIRYFSSRALVEAISAEGLRIKVRRQENHDHGPLVFWKDFARKQLVEGRGLEVSEERDLGRDRTLIVGSREVGGQDVGYMLALKRTARRVYTFEAWGPKAVFDTHRDALEASARSLER